MNSRIGIIIECLNQNNERFLVRPRGNQQATEGLEVLTSLHWQTVSSYYRSKYSFESDSRLSEKVENSGVRTDSTNSVTYSEHTKIICAIGMQWNYRSKLALHVIKRQKA
jgi:hypothetical protein